MTAFTLDPKPSFKLTVEIPVPGDGYVPVEFECKYRNQEELRSFNEAVAAEGKPGLPNDEVLKAIIVGWSLTDPCTPENIEKLSKNYQGSASAVYLAYLDELLKVRRKN